MKLTKKLEAEILKLYSAYWDAYLKGDMKTFASMLDDNITVFGTAVSEVFNNKKETVRFYKATADQMTGKAEFRNRQIRMQPVDNTIVINEQTDLYVLIEKEWTYYGHARVTAIFKQTEGKWKLVHQHASFPDSKAEEGEQISAEKIKAENLELREAVKRRTIELEQKNRELEIETSLERVRAVAMGIKKPDDILEICKVMFTELQSLGFSDLRNTLINFWDDARDSLIDYDYSDYKGSNKAILSYSSHPVFEQFQKKIRTSKDAFAKLAVKKEQLESWKQRRRESGEYEDPRLNNISALYYYFYSIGVGAIGISTFSSLSAEKLNLLKRFRNVFDFAYQRYADVAQAEAQSREAQIELALERVRARAMAMQNSDELSGLVATLFEELTKLNLILYRCIIWIFDPDSLAARIWMANSEEKKGAESYFINKLDHPYYDAILKGWKEKNMKWVYDLHGKDKKTIDKLLLTETELTHLPEVVKAGILSSKHTIVCGSFNNFGLIEASGPVQQTDEQLEILSRFGKVFDQTYTRFLDLQKAEEQVREARIEAGLERVRSRAMAMHKTDELLDAAELIQKELSALGIKSMNVSYAFVDEEEKYASYYSVNPVDGKVVPFPFVFPHTETGVMRSILSSWKKREPFNLIELDEEATLKHQTYIGEHIQNLIIKNKIDIPFSIGEFLAISPKKAVIYTFNFTSGYLFNIGGARLTKMQEEMVLRFTKVFEMTYRRFLDLKHAEAQAKEAQIEAALERVRSRTMGMQKSEELKEVIQVVYQQFVHLNIHIDHTGFVMDYKARDDYNIWLADPLGSPSRVTIPYFDSVYYNRFNEAKEKGMDFFAVNMDFEEKNRFYQKLFEIIPELPEESKAALLNCPGLAISTVLLENVCLYIENFEGIPYSEEDNATLMRFGKVFQQTYTRFLDLQKAEEQAREAKIEAALERTRTQSMIMQHSKELDDTLRVFHEQVLLLGIRSAFSYLWLPDEERERHIFWAAWAENVSPAQSVNHNSIVLKSKAINYPLDRNEPATAQCLIDWKGNEPIFTYHVPPSGVEDYFATWQELIAGVEQLKPAYFRDGLSYVEAFMKYGCFGVLAATDLRDDEKKILGRFANEFERTYRRFLDLQKAEAQAREAQIETALEKVRSRTMGMQQSLELGDVATVLFKELNQLVDNLWSCGFVLCEKDRGEDEWWLSTGDGFIPAFYLPNTGDATHANIYDAWKKGEVYHTEQLEGEALQQHYDWLMSIAVSKNIFDKMEVAGKSLPSWQKLHCAYFSYGYLVMITQVPCPEEQIFKRFAKVFDQTYTRFLDLQKAEDQVREAQIETGLERVRSKTMAMHKSEEVTGVAVTLNEELLKLGFEGGSTIIIIDRETGDTEQWTGFSEDKSLKSCYVPYFKHPYHDAQFGAWKKSEKFLVYTVAGDEKRSLDEHYFSTGYKDFPESDKKWMRQMESVTFSHAFMKYGSIHWGPTHLTEEQLQILQRFSKVFEQSYRRFLDLQKAETQAREAQIEAALEKVRSRSLAMHQSDELKDVIMVVSEQLQHLQFRFHNASFVRYNEQQGLNFWLASPGQPQPYLIEVPSLDNPIYTRPLEALKNGVDFIADVLTPDENHLWLDHLLKHSVLKNVSEDDKKFLRSTAGFARSLVLTKHIMLVIGNYAAVPYTEEQNLILKRFGNVFEQAYTRFLDLQKAEAQAREAQIEAALERVRSRSLAMHKSEELSELVAVLYEKMNGLGVISDGININIIKEGTKDFESWLAAPGQSYAVCFNVSYFKHPVTDEIFEAIKSGKDLLTKVYSFEEKASFFNYLYNHTDFRNLPEERKKMVLDSKNWEVSIAFAKNTALSLHSYSGKIFSNNENEILKRFAKVFEQSYTRFLDLKKAEAQAREANIEASLERVRSKAMAMQKSEDLAQAVAIVFEELDKLSLGMLRCGIGILNKEKRSADVWTTTKSENDTVVQVSGDESMDIHPLLHGAFEAWLKQEDHSYVLKGEDLHNYYKALTGVNFKLPHSQLLTTGNDDIVQYYYNAVFSFGGLFAFRETEFPPEARAVMRRFADVFTLTYTRFNDLQQAEAQAREAKIEAAMEKVRSRAMAMQKPEELVEVAHVLRREMGLLGVEELETSSIYIHDAVSGTTECWYAIQDVRGTDKKLMTDHMTINLNDTWVGREMLKFYKSDQKQTSILMQGENRKKWINYCAQHSKILQEYFGDVIPERTYHLLKFSNGYMGAASAGEISTESWELLKRATSVFSLAYTRFNDLQLAEANAKEAIKQSALDRVRAEIASMRTKNDLERITPLVWNELTTLGVPFIRCGVFIMDDSHELIHTFLSTPDGKAIAAFHLPYNTPGNIAQVLIHWRDKNNYIDHWDESAFTEFAAILEKQGDIASAEKYLKTIPGGGFYLHFLPFLQGMLYVGNTSQLGGEEINLIQSVADAFSTAYARYEDFNNLEAAKQQVDKTLVDLKQAQTQLVQSEKMASLGELTAGIAHEIQNPLNFVNNFSDVSQELLDEMRTELEKGNAKDAIAIAEDVKQNLEKILHHGKRADAIVKGMLQHSRTSSGQKEPTDMNALVDEYLRLAYHGLRAKDKSFNANFTTDLDPAIGKVNIIPQEFGRVVLNLINNAFYAISEKKKIATNGYEPTLSIITKREGDTVVIRVKDNGNGIPQKLMDKIFQPFFTTKPTGQGTGLGLSLSYDIITKGHDGQLKVETREGEGAEFIIQLPGRPS